MRQAKCASGATMPAVLALLNTEAINKPNASSLAAKNSSSTSRSEGSEDLRKDAQHTTVTAALMINSMMAYVIIQAAQTNRVTLQRASSASQLIRKIAHRVAQEAWSGFVLQN